MKKHNQIIFLIVLLAIILLPACSSARLQAYYADKENYISANGTISYIFFDDAKNMLYLEFTDLQPQFDDTCFKIVGKNCEHVLQEDILSQINIGTEVAFMSAPRYFGDGYAMPIVAISVNGYSFLDFNEGFNNLNQWLESN